MLIVGTLKLNKRRFLPVDDPEGKSPGHQDL